MNPPGEKKLMLYIGDQKFPQDFAQMRDMITSKKKYLRDLHKTKQSMTKYDESEVQVDREYFFLSKFPGMKEMYSKNRDILKANEEKPKLGFDLRYGDWVPPSCCSMFINALQFFFTFYSLIL